MPICQQTLRIVVKQVSLEYTREWSVATHLPIDESIESSTRAPPYLAVHTPPGISILWYRSDDRKPLWARKLGVVSSAGNLVIGSKYYLLQGERIDPSHYERGLQKKHRPVTPVR